MNRKRVLRNKPVFKRYRRRNRNIINKLAPNYSQRVQVMGPGRTICRVTTTVDNDVAAQANLVLELNNIILLNNEFLSFKYDYEYFRIRCIKIIKLPSNLNSELSYFNCYVMWKNEQTVPLELLDVSDKTKKIPLNNYRVVNFKFKPPDAMIPVGDSVYNPRKCMPTDINNIEGYIYFNNPSVTSGSSYRLFLSIEVIIEFKGGRRLRPDAKIKLMLKDLEKQKRVLQQPKEDVKEKVKKKNKHREKHRKQKEKEEKKKIEENKEDEKELVSEKAEESVDWKEVTSSIDEDLESKGDVKH